MIYEYLTLGIRHAQGLSDELKNRIPLEQLSWKRTKTAGNTKDLESKLSASLMKDLKVKDYSIDTYQIYEAYTQIGILEVHTYRLENKERCLKVEYKGIIPGFDSYDGKPIHLIATERQDPDSFLKEWNLNFSCINNTAENPLFRQDDTPIRLADHEKLPRTFPEWKRRYTRQHETRQQPYINTF